MFRMKSVVGAIAVAAMVSTSAFAAATDSALAPGKPAGVKEALSIFPLNPLFWFGTAVFVGTAITISQQSGNKGGQPTSFAPATTAP